MEVDLTGSALKELFSCTDSAVAQAFKKSITWQ